MLRSVRARDERVTGATCCSCQFSTAFGGLICCHCIRVVDVKGYGVDVFQRILALISDRWLVDAIEPSVSKRREANLRALPDPNLMSAPRMRARQQFTRQDRVPVLRAKCSAVLDLGASSDRAFEAVVLALDNAHSAATPACERRPSSWMTVVASTRRGTGSRSKARRVEDEESWRTASAAECCTCTSSDESSGKSEGRIPASNNVFRPCSDCNANLSTAWQHASQKREPC